MRRNPWRDSCPDFPDLIKTFQTQTLGATLQFASKPGCSATLVRFISIHSRPYVQTFRTQTLGATMQFGFKSACGATLGATLVQTFQTLYPDFPDSNSWRESPIWVKIRMRRDHWRESCPDFPDLMTRLSRFKLSARLCNLRLNPDAAQPLA